MPKTPKAKAVVDDRPPPRKPSARSSAKAKRSAARLTAVQILYQAALNNQQAQDARQEFIDYRIGQIVDEVEIVPADRETLDTIIDGASDSQEQIDSLIAASLKTHSPDRIELLMRCIMRAALAELLFDRETPQPIIISDYLSVAEAFYEFGPEIKLINGILDKAARHIRENKPAELTDINDTF